MTTGPEPASKAETDAHVREGLEVIGHLLRQFRAQLGPSFHLEDLRSAGNEGLTLAIRDYDGSRGVPFRRWANLRVKGAMIDAMRAGGQLPRRVYRQLRALEAAHLVTEGRADDDAAMAQASHPEQADAQAAERLKTLAMAMALSFLSMRQGEEAYAVADPKPSAEELLHRESLMARVRVAMLALPQAEQTLIEQHYFADRTLDEVGKSLGLSKSWASRLHARALETVARALRGESM
jgi:RNA polymerase sigma factor FliA